MKEQVNFKLIDGTFSLEESKEILTSLYTSKIQFHQRKNFSSEERFGKEDQNAKIRIPQLEKNLEEIIEILKKIEDENLSLEISANITLNFKES